MTPIDLERLRDWEKLKPRDHNHNLNDCPGCIDESFRDAMWLPELPALLSEVERLRKENERLQKEKRSDCDCNECINRRNAAVCEQQGHIKCEHFYGCECGYIPRDSSMCTRCEAILSKDDPSWSDVRAALEGKP